jgi:hypothetical protein
LVKQPFELEGRNESLWVGVRLAHIDTRQENYDSSPEDMVGTVIGGGAINLKLFKNVDGSAAEILARNRHTPLPNFGRISGCSDMYAVLHCRWKRRLARAHIFL